MVQFLYFAALGLAAWGVAILAWGEFAAMLDIGSSLVASAAVVAGLGAVAGGLHRIARALQRVGEMLPETSVEPQAERHFADDRAFGAPVAAAAAAPPWHGEESPGVGWADDHAPAETLLEPAIADSGLPPEAEPPADPESERVIRSGTLDGVLYRFFADGSVESVTEQGPRRFASVDELKDAILAARRAAAASAPKEVPEEAFPHADEPAPQPSRVASLAAGAPRTDPARFDRKAARAERRAAKMSSPRIETIEPQPGEADESSRGHAEPAAAEPPPVAPVRVAPLHAEPVQAEPVRREVLQVEHVHLERVRVAAELPPRASAEPPPAPVEAEPAPAEPEPLPAPRPESRLERFEEDIWAATLAELRRPFEDALAGKSAPGSASANPDEPPSRP